MGDPNQLDFFYRKMEARNKDIEEKLGTAVSGYHHRKLVQKLESECDPELHLKWIQSKYTFNQKWLDFNKECKPLYRLVDVLSPTREIMRMMDKFYFNDNKEFDSPIYWRDEYDYPLTGDYIKELDGVVNFMGLMTFTLK